MEVKDNKNNKTMIRMVKYINCIIYCYSSYK